MGVSVGSAAGARLRRESILLIPFVQHTNGPRWHAFVVRIYLDNEIAETLGNWPYGYFKQLAAFEEMQTGPTHDLDVVRELAQMFEWQATGSVSLPSRMPRPCRRSPITRTRSRS